MSPIGNAVVYQKLNYNVTGCMAAVCTIFTAGEPPCSIPIHTVCRSRIIASCMSKRTGTGLIVSKPLCRMAKACFQCEAPYSSGSVQGVNTFIQWRNTFLRFKWYSSRFGLELSFKVLAARYQNLIRIALRISAHKIQLC